MAEEWSPSSLISKALASDMDPGVFSILNEDDIPKAKNFAEFCLGKKFLNIVPYPRQLQIGLGLFEDHCVAKGTLVQTNNGLIPIENISNTRGLNKVDNFNISTEYGISRISRAGKTGKNKKCVLISLSDGKTLRVTSNHLIKVLKEDLTLTWVEAGKLKKGDRAVSSFGANLWPDSPASLPPISVRLDSGYYKYRFFEGPTSVTPELAALVGYILADGYNGKYGLGFCNNSFELFEDFVHCYKSVFGESLKIPNSDDSGFFEKTWYRRAYQIWLDKIGFHAGNCYTKEIPNFILQSDRKSVIAFIRAVMDCDGYVDTFENKPRIGLTMANRGVVKIIGLLLNNLGIPNRYREWMYKGVSSREDENYKNKRATLEVFWTHHKTYLEVIGSQHPQKLENLKTCASIVSKRNYKSTGRGLNTILPEFLPFGKNIHLMAMNCRNNYHDKTPTKYLCSRSNCVSIYSLLETAGEYFKTRNEDLFYRIQNLSKLRQYYPSVLSVETCGNFDVYDVTVPETSSFLAEGLVVHNCPTCTNPAWVQGDEKQLDLFDQPISEILDNVQFLEFGKCPKCGVDRNSLVKQGYFHNPTELAACCGQRCVVSDTNILTTDGLVEIADYAKDKPVGFSPFSKKIHTGKNIGETTDFFVGSPEQTYIVSLSNGLSIVGTADHPILTENGFIKIKDLKIGSALPVSVGQGIFGNSIPNYNSFHKIIEKNFIDWEKKRKIKSGCIKNHKIPSGQMTLEDARFLGYLISEGNTSIGLRVSNTDPVILDFCSKIFLKWFGVYHKTKKDISLRTHRASLFAKCLLGNKITTEKSKDKQIPLCIRKAPRDYVCYFLSGLYDGDGYVSSRSVEYTSISKKLSYQVSLMLQNLGIPNKIYSKMAHATNGSLKQKPVKCYTVVVEGPAIISFKENITFGLKRKQDKVNAAIKNLNQRKLNTPFWYQKYSLSKRSLFLSLLADIQSHLNKQPHPYNKKSPKLGLRSVLGEKGADTYRRMKKADNVALSKDKALKLLLPFKDSFWTQFLSEELRKRIYNFIELSNSTDYFVTVTDISDGPIDTTYDFTVAGEHSFWTNGITSSNSGKSAVTAMIGAYVLHRYLSIPDPVNYLNLLSSSQLYMSMTAISAGQAEASLWAPFREYVDAAPWFKDYHQLLQDAGERLGVELLHRPRTFLVYKHKRIVCMYEAPNKRRLRGKTRIFCVSGDTQVTTNLGSFKIEDLFSLLPTGSDRVDKVKGLTVATPSGFEEATHLFQYKNVPGIKIEGEDGTQLKGTTAHPIYVYNPIDGFSMKKLEHIVPGEDYLVLDPPKFNVFPIDPPLISFSYQREYASDSRSAEQIKVMNRRTHSHFPNELTEDLAELMGFLWAEGSLGKNVRKNGKSTTYRLRFTSSDSYCLERYKKLFFSCFGIEPKLTRAVGKSWNLDSQSASICQFMNYLGYEYGGCKIKDVPWVIRKAPREMVVSFLRSFFDGDGMATDKEVSIDISAEKLAEGIKYLLFNLGILSKMYRYERYGNKYYKVRMFGKNRKLFFERVGFGLERKQKFNAIGTTDFTSRNETILIDATTLSNSIINNHRSVWKTTDGKEVKLSPGCLVEMHTLMKDITTTNGKRIKKVNPRMLSSNFMKNLKIVDEKLHDTLEKVRNGLYFSKIVTKTDIGNIDVYDFTIEPSHLFIANGIINGNSSIDELGWLEADASKQSVTLSADEISAALDNSLRTVRSAAQIKRKQGLYNSIDAYACNISSPSEKDDKMMRNVRAARTNRTIYACHYPTWEANPTITRESLQPEFDKSKMVAERDFGAIPPLANDPFIDNPHCIDLMIDPNHRHNLMQVKIEYHTDDFGNKTKYASVNIPQIDKRKPRMLLVDAGEKRNHFAVMLMTWDSKRNRPRVDYVFDVTPEEGIPINFTLMWEHCFKPIVHSLLIKHMFSDTWNSTDLVQNLRQAKVMSEQYSLRFQDFVEIAARLASGEMILPKPELPVEDLMLTYENPVEFVEGKPILTLILQMLTVRQVGRRITKPIHGDDDMFRALCLGMYHIVQPHYKKLYAVDAAGGAGGNIGVILSKNWGSGGIDKNKTTSGAVLATKRGYKNR